MDHVIRSTQAGAIMACLCLALASPSSRANDSNTTVATNFAFQAKLTANDGTAESFLGQRVGISGNTAIAFAQSAVYVFVRSGSTWTQQAKLIPSDGIGVASFIKTAAISGDTVVIGGSSATINSNASQGAAYVFVRSGTTWTEQLRLTASDGAAQDQFGRSVSIDGNTIIAGSANDDIGSNTDQGSAYIFVQQSGVWTEQAKLLANDGAANDLFGVTVSVNANTVAVSKGLFSPSAIPAVYVFARSGTIWTQQDKLSVCEPSASVCSFGRQSLAISGDTLITSNPGANNGSNTAQGAAYVFVRSGTTWSQQQKLIANDGQADSNFGNTVAIEGDTVVVGAFALNVRPGAAYVFTRAGAIWTQEQKLQDTIGTGDAFGESVSLSGNTILVGFARDTVNGNTHQGSAYVFVAPNPINTIQFDAANYTVGEGGTSATVTVTRTGDVSAATTVGYATSDTAGLNNCNVLNTGNASSRCDYETNIGTFLFGPGETSKTVPIPIVNDTYAEGDESFTITLSNPSGATLQSPAVATITIQDNDAVNGSNPIDQVNFFVRQHYIDFLNREPDADGLAYWANQITECQQPGATCDANLRRINVSAAFFVSIEFQETGYLVERLYKAAYGDADGLSQLDTYPSAHPIKVPIIRLNEFLPDSQEIGRNLVVGTPGWDQVLENNKVAFIQRFVQRTRLTTAFPSSLSPDQFVDKLFQNAGVTPTSAERTAAINQYGSGDTAGRARALRLVAENGTLNQNERNRAFVLMQYFGYLRRNPDDPQDTNHTGFDFWLTKLNQFNGNFVNAQMVQAFIESIEYRGRFGP